MASDRREYISDLKVKYGESSGEAPLNALRELSGLSNNINHRCGGKHVWLIPTYTTDSGAAATSFHIVVQTHSDSKMDDLAKGAGGGYRYIFSKADPDIPRKITHALLLRSNGSISTAPLGWDLITVDINKGRRKSYLYILAKTVATETSSKAFLNVPSVGGYLTVRSNTPKQYVQALNVCYGDDLSELPADCVGELNGLSADVNFQCGGKFTWLVPSYTPDAAKAATSFDVLFLNTEDPKMDDLAKGAGGDFRYIVARSDRKVGDKITQVMLFRSETSTSAPPVSWNGITTPDLNQGRQKGYLYLIWKTVSTNSWSFVSLASISSYISTSNTNQFIKSLKVCYGDDTSEMPIDVVHECSGQSSDINHQYGGKYVWLVPEYTNDPNIAASAFEVSVQTIAQSGYDDLAKGAGGDFRYLIPKCNTQARAKIREIELLRSAEVIVTPPVGWDGMTKNINIGRQKTFLYVLWKNAKLA